MSKEKLESGAAKSENEEDRISVASEISDEELNDVAGGLSFGSSAGVQSFDTIYAGVGPGVQSFRTVLVGGDFNTAFGGLTDKLKR